MADENGKESNEVDMKALMTQMQNITQAVGSLATGLDSNQKNIEALTGTVNSLTSMSKQQLENMQSVDDDDDDDFGSELGANDLEGMNRMDFMNHILGQVNKGFERIADQIGSQVSTVKDSVETTNLKQELNEVRESNPDFDHFKEEIAAVAKANPNMAIKDMYVLAKANNPQKVEEVTKTLETQTLENEKKAAEEAKKTQSKGFGGLTPTSGQKTEIPTDMTQEAAGNAAWDETMANIELEQ